MDATTDPTPAAAAATGGDALLVVDDLHVQFKTHRGIVQAIDGVSLRLKAGESLGIVGESGSGKSVLSRAIMGLLPRRITQQSGTVVFQGRDISAATVDEMRAMWGSEIAMIFQDPMSSLNPVVKVGRQITEAPCLRHGLSRSDARDRAVELLHSVGISEPRRRLDQYPHELSGGMRQRALIAIALACNPHLLMADEPTTALDVTVQAQILELLDEQRRQRDMGLVLVTHDFGVAAGRTDRITVMYAGQVMEAAPTRELFQGMRHPYTRSLLDAIPRMDHPVHHRLSAIPGNPPDLVNRPRGCPFAARCRNAQDRCLEERPPLTAPDHPDHFFACFYPEGTDEGAQARDRNLAAGHTAAGTPVGVS